MIIGDSTAHGGHMFHPSSAVAPATDKDDGDKDDLEYLDDAPSILRCTSSPLFCCHFCLHLAYSGPSTPHQHLIIKHPCYLHKPPPLQWLDGCGLNHTTFWCTSWAWGQTKTGLHHCFSPSCHPRILRSLKQSIIVESILVEPLITQPLVKPLITAFIKCLSIAQPNFI